MLAAGLLLACGSGDPIADVRQLHASGQYEASLEPLRDLIDQRPDDPEVHYLYGIALMGAGRPSLALWSFRKAMEDPEWLVPAGIQLAQSELQSASEDGAEAAASQVLEIEPDNVDALMLRARARINSRRNYEGALADLDRMLELEPDNPEAPALRIVCLLGLERVEEASAEIDKLEISPDEEAASPGNPNYCTGRAMFAKEKGEPELAEERYEACLAEFPDDLGVIREAIDFFDEQNNLQRGLEILQGALEDAPRAPMIRSSLARRLRAMGRNDESEAVLLEATEFDDPNLQYLAWTELAFHYNALGANDEAADARGRAIALLDPPDPQSLFGYAEMLLIAGRYDEALEVASQMEVAAHRHLIEGRVFLEQDKPEEALAAFTEGTRLWPDNAAARYLAGRAAERTGDFDRAVEEYRYSLRIDAGATSARDRLAQLHEAEGQLDLALAAAWHNWGRSPGDLELDLLAIRIAARMGNSVGVNGAMRRLSEKPEQMGHVYAAVAEGIGEARGAEAAVTAIRDNERIDLTQPHFAPTLRLLVEELGRAGRAHEGVARAEAAVSARPRSPVAYEILGFAWSQSDAEDARQRSLASYEKALELAPNYPVALAGAAAATEDDAAALALYERALQTDPENADALLGAAERLQALGRDEEAAERLDAYLEERPFDGQVSRRLGELLLEGPDADRRRALVLARHAVRFGGGEDARKLLTRAEAERPAPAG